MDSADETVDEVTTRDYLVTETREVLVAASSAADARSTAELIFQLTPNNKVITSTVNVERVRN